MGYGLNISPGYNTPRRYQTFSEGNLNEWEDTAGQQQGIGRALEGAGAGQMSKWGGRGDRLYGLASGIASREPSWYADRAGVTSNQAFDESKGVQERTLSRMGINPNSGRFVGLQTQWGLARAAAEAGARTRAAQDAEQTAFGRQSQLLNMADRGYGEGAGLMGRAGYLYNQAGNDYRGLAGEYDRLATESGQEEATEKAIAVNTSQARINDMLSQMKELWKPTQAGQPSPITGIIKYHPQTSRQFIPGIVSSRSFGGGF